MVLRDKFMKLQITVFRIYGVATLHLLLTLQLKRKTMKKSIFILILLAGITTTLSAQSLRKTEKINEEQVPVAIRGAFEKDFGTIPAEGYWTAHFAVEQEGARSIAVPISYTFHKRNKGEKIEVRYLPDGKLDFVKGLEKANNTNTR